MLKIYRAYEEVCQRQGMVDFAELLLRAHEIWLNQPALLAHYQRRFRYILVDEFQDTNAIQYAWLRVLSAGKIPMMAVGDDDQSIYGWRGARIENIQQYSQDFPGTEIIKLEQNYRSTGTILKAANSVIANNQGRLGKELWTSGEDGELISVYAGFNEQDEARFIVDRLQDWSRAGNARSDSAILYRSNAQSRTLEEALIRAGVPYRIYGGQRFYERLEIKNALAYLRLIANPHDDTAIERIINTPTRGIGARSIEQLRELARSQGISLWSALEKSLANNLFPARASSALRAFVELIRALDKDTDEMTLGELVAYTIKQSGLKVFHANEKGEKGQARVENLDELITAAEEFEPEDDEENPDRSPLLAFLDEAALNAGEQQAEAFEDSVQLMTLHSAKGLEFPLVVVAGMEENLFPHKMSLEEPGRLEEERRLCYVGITRAMQKLYLTYAESRRLYGSESINAPSRFLREIPKEFLQEVRLGTAVTRPVSYRNQSISSGSANGLHVGQQVLHEIFGEGTIINVEGSGANARVQVNFADAGVKWLVYQYANLQAI
jgi:DNA helicase-2/ATP-dependent DNA helicase PcrA